MPTGPRDLYEHCWGCRGTRKTTTAFNEGRPGHLPAGSPCPLCDDGYTLIGVTYGQFERLLADLDRLLLAVAATADCSTDPADKARSAAVLAGRAAEVEEARRRVNADLKRKGGRDAD